MKLYHVAIRAIGKLRDAYILAADPTEAYGKYRVWLDEKTKLMPAEKSMDSVHLMAEATEKPECGNMLIL